MWPHGNRCPHAGTSLTAAGAPGPGSTGVRWPVVVPGSDQRYPLLRVGNPAIPRIIDSMTINLLTALAVTIGILLIVLCAVVPPLVDTDL
ncbi:hypothetical protein GCM10028815_17290 [Mariniluteicoccus flavus]